MAKEDKENVYWSENRKSFTRRGARSEDMVNKIKGLKKEPGLLAKLLEFLGAKDKGSKFDINNEDTVR